MSDQTESFVLAMKQAPQNLLLLTEVGSHAYGIDRPESDYDYSGTYAIPLRRYLSFHGTGADTVVCPKLPDATYHDIGKFCRLAVAGNPNVLDVLWGPVRYMSSWGERLLSIRKAFLHRGSLKPYFGYYTAQSKRLASGFALHTKGGEWNPKFAAHLLRLMFAARHLAETGDVLVRLDSEKHKAVWDARSGKLTPEETLTLGESLRQAAAEAEQHTALPVLPDKKTIDAFLFDCRMAFQ